MRGLCRMQRILPVQHPGVTPTAHQGGRLGVGLGYRAEFAGDVAALHDSVDCLELTVEQYLDTTPERLEHLHRVCRSFAVTTHSVELSIGSEDGWDEAHAERVAGFAVAVGAAWFSDHICFTRAGGTPIGALTPVRRDRAMAHLIARRAARLQATSGLPFLLENITAHLDPGGPLSEPEFIREVCEHADCGLLLDLANLSINAHNLRYDPYDYLDAYPLERVVEVHVAGGTVHAGTAFDSHSEVTPSAVWELLEAVVERADVGAVIIERDDNIPESARAFEPELDMARRILRGP